MTDIMDFPLPSPDFELLAPLWDGAAAGTFQLPRCRPCGRFDWYPRGNCRDCGSEDIAWTALSGRASLFSWAVVHRALHKPLASLGTYISAIVQLDEDSRTRFVTRLIDADPETLSAGMAVEVRFHDAGYPTLETGRVVPLFTPTSS